MNSNSQTYGHFIVKILNLLFLAHGVMNISFGLMQYGVVEELEKRQSRRQILIQLLLFNGGTECYLAWRCIRWLKTTGGILKYNYAFSVFLALMTQLIILFQQLRYRTTMSNLEIYVSIFGTILGIVALIVYNWFPNLVTKAVKKTK